MSNDAEMALERQETMRKKRGDPVSRQEVLRFILGELEEGRQPSYTTINEHFGISSAYYHVQWFVKHGILGRTGPSVMFVQRGEDDVLADPEFQAKYPQVAEELAMYRRAAMKVES